MSEELKKIQKLKDQLGNLADKIDMLVNMNETETIKFAEKFKKHMKAPESQLLNFVILISLVAIVFSILVFFGYKLYKSLVEKDRKREEKRKMKQQKKKK